VANYLFRLWVHDAEDGRLPEVEVSGETRLQAAARALHHFVSIGRPIGYDSYMQCEPSDGEGLRVSDVLRWLNQGGNALFDPPADDLDPSTVSIHYTSLT
jgi:hypothetical protein